MVCFCVQIVKTFKRISLKIFVGGIVQSDQTNLVVRMAKFKVVMGILNGVGYSDPE